MKEKQKVALEKITGKPWDSWSPEAVEAYFIFTDKGQKVPVPEGAQPDFDELIFAHKFHPVSVEMWKQDFRGGLLSLDDFFRSPLPPDAYIRHAAEIYVSVHRFLPYRWRWWFNRGSTSYKDRKWQWGE